MLEILTLPEVPEVPERMHKCLSYVQKSDVCVRERVRMCTRAREGEHTRACLCVKFG